MRVSIGFLVSISFCVICALVLCAFVLYIVGIELFDLKPKGIDNRRIIETSMLNKPLSSDIVKEVLVALCGEYVLETDILSVLKGTTLLHLSDTLPEFFKAQFIFGGGTNECSDRATVNPYIIVMGMDVEQRYMGTLAVKNAEQEKRIRVQEFRIGGTGFVARATLQPMLANVTPLTQDYVAVAKKYGIKEIVPAMTAFKKACDLYTKIWTS